MARVAAFECLEVTVASGRSSASLRSGVGRNHGTEGRSSPVSRRRLHSPRRAPGPRGLSPPLPQKNVAAGRVWPDCGAGDTETNAVAHALPVAAALAGTPGMLAAVERVVRVTQVRAGARLAAVGTSESESRAGARLPSSCLEGGQMNMRA